jgi:hypothetical protein
MAKANSDFIMLEDTLANWAQKLMAKPVVVQTRLVIVLLCCFKIGIFGII